MATKRQKQAAYNRLMAAIHEVEAAQHNPSVMACAADGLIDQSSINSAKDSIYHAIRRLEAV